VKGAADPTLRLLRLCILITGGSAVVGDGFVALVAVASGECTALPLLLRDRASREGSDGALWC
jgi:hypothetical protein